MLLCDEPTGNLDSANTDSVLALFDELSDDGLTLIMVTHEDAGRRARRAGACAWSTGALDRGGGVSRRRRDRAVATGPRMGARDLLSEAFAGLIARPARVALTVLGTVIGVGALVATLGLSKTAGNQIVGRFDALAATDVVVSPVGPRRRRRRARSCRGTPRRA